MRIKASELLAPVFDEIPELTVGWPDDEIVLRLRDTAQLQAVLGDVLRSARAVWGDGALLVDIDANHYHRCLSVKVVQVDPPPFDEDAAASRRALMDECILPLKAYCEGRRGYASRSWSGDSFGFGLPHAKLGPELASRKKTAPLSDDWDERHRQRLSGARWSDLRSEVHRFWQEANAIVDWCVRGEVSTVLVPSVGLCVHPYLFAEQGMSVVATDASPAALDAIAHPERRPRMYGVAAKRRWEISESSMWGGGRLTSGPMPAIERSEVADELRARIEWLECDWAELPLASDSVDAIFATNALPRGDDELRARVFAQWERVARSGALLFVYMHNDYGGARAGSFFESRGWLRVNALRGQRGAPGVRVFQEYLSSG